MHFLPSGGQQKADMPADETTASYLAAVADALGPPSNYTLRWIKPRPLERNELRIAVRAAGVSFVDVLVAAGQYQALPTVPFTPGSECAGIVEEIGAEVRAFAVGDKVIGTGWAGMFAQSVILQEDAVWQMPSNLSFAEAATLPVSYLTAWHGLVDRGRLRAGETLLVLGAAGGTGFAAVQIGLHLGARVIASASSETKRALARSAGADAVVDSSSADWRTQVNVANAGNAIDVIFDPVGGRGTEQAFRTLAYDGRHLIVGFPAGAPSLPMNLPLLKSASLIGVNLPALSAAEPARAAEHRRAILQLACAGKLKPAVFKAYALDEFGKAMEQARNGRCAGRIVLAV
jgi:NADPH:quinone reductase